VYVDKSADKKRESGEFSPWAAFASGGKRNYARMTGFETVFDLG
jgi:hypothetical protein